MEATMVDATVQCTHLLEFLGRIDTTIWTLVSSILGPFHLLGLQTHVASIVAVLLKIVSKPNIFVLEVFGCLGNKVRSVC